MLNLGASEILLIAVVACLLTDPQKIPNLIKSAGMFYRKFSEIRREVYHSFKEVCDSDPALNGEITQQQKHIVGSDGKLHVAYEVDTIEEDKVAFAALETSSASETESREQAIAAVPANVEKKSSD